MSIFDLLLYLLYEGMNIPLIYGGTIPSQFLKTVDGM